MRQHIPRDWRSKEGGDLSPHTECNYVFWRASLRACVRVCGCVCLASDSEIGFAPVRSGRACMPQSTTGRIVHCGHHHPSSRSLWWDSRWHNSWGALPLSVILVVNFSCSIALYEKHRWPPQWAVLLWKRQLSAFFFYFFFLIIWHLKWLIDLSYLQSAQ